MDVFLPFGGVADTAKTLAELEGREEIGKVFLLVPPQADTDGLMQKSECVEVDAMESASTVIKMASLAESPYAILVLKSSPINFGARALHRMREALDWSGRSMVYADHWSVEQGETKAHPLIDFQEGSLRNDFDFGSVLLFSTATLRHYAESKPKAWKYGGIYDLWLFALRERGLFHLNEMLYTEEESDLRKTGEKQFDYVNPAQRAVQIEMEEVCTEHLKRVGAYLAPDDFDEVDLKSEAFRYEASVVIPVRNRERTIADAIESVLGQKTDFDFNLIIVDNHSTDGTTAAIEKYKNHPQVVHLIPERTDLGIGGCWDYAACSPYCGKFAVQLDSDDIYSSPDTLQKIVDAFYEQHAAMIIGSYKLVDMQLRELPPGVIDHKEWTEANGRNNALRINGLGAPRAFYTPLIREVGFPNTSYGEDYAVGLAVSRRYRIGRIYDVLYLCRRWEGNSDAALSIEKQNKNNLYKDRLRTLELRARRQLNERWNQQPTQEEAKSFFEEQLRTWPAAERRFQDLKNVELKHFDEQGVKLSVQFNPARIVSTGAKVDKKTIAERKCFLCEHHQPKEQNHFYVLGRYQLCVNPFPILPYHFTLPTRRHIPQLARPMIDAFCQMAQHLSEFVVLYNGAQCGASAPDHAHLQLGAKGQIPLQRDWKTYESSLEPVYTLPTGQGIYLLRRFAYPLFVLRLSGKEHGHYLFDKLLNSLPIVDGEAEPRFNLLGWNEGEGLVIALIPRRKLRPECYFKEGEQQYLISPGSVDMGGLIITPRREDFERLTADKVCSILREVTLSEDEIMAAVAKLKGEPTVSVGIMHADRLRFTLHSDYDVEGQTADGSQEASYSKEGILWNGKIYREILFTPHADDATFTLHDVMIGINFHWERREDQTFKGCLKLMVENDSIVAVNLLLVEDYLESVISSEMKATAGLEFLKAAAIISRSWLLSQIRNRESETTHADSAVHHSNNADESITWTDREAHSLYDVCADDHCQRYQGVIRATSATVREAVQATRGLIIGADGDICDARFAKCCGGISEEYAACWEDADYSYLQPIRDLPDGNLQVDLTKEADAENWIRSDASAFCNTHDKEVLRQVLNDYDLETQDFYRWQMDYTQEEISSLIREKTGIDFGHILDLQPVARGKSGRLYKLRIVGTKRSMVIGKELSIRRALSKSHLYSSAVVVEKGDERDGIPQEFRLIGAGWGHGVGLCLIGAAVMGAMGASYEEILLHYYKGAQIERIY